MSGATRRAGQQVGKVSHLSYKGGLVDGEPKVAMGQRGGHHEWLQLGLQSVGQPLPCATGEEGLSCLPLEKES